MTGGDFKGAIVHRHPRQANAQRGEDFNIALSLDYESIRAYYDRGLAEAALGDYATAIRDFSTILVSDGTDGPAFYQKGMARISAGDPAGGCAELRWAVEHGVEGSDTALEEMCN